MILCSAFFARANSGCVELALSTRLWSDHGVPGSPARDRAGCLESCRRDPRCLAATAEDLAEGGRDYYILTGVLEEGDQTKVQRKLFPASVDR